MADFPAVLDSPNAVTYGTWCDSTLVGDYSLWSSGAFTSTATWPAVDRALYVPFQVDIPFTAKTIALVVAIQSGNLDVGIYDEKGNRIVSKGSTAVAAAGNQFVDLTASVTGTASPVLQWGTYYLAMNCDNTTASFNKQSTNAALTLEVCGVQQQAVGAVTLPATATFANPASAYVPLMTLTGQTI
jgi:hypothetical protein